MKILVINGPNLNMLGIRAPEIYGTQTYADLVAFLLGVGEAEGIEIEVFQSNSEGEIITKIQEAYGKADGIVINPAAYTHTSIAIADAIEAVSLPTVEVHISDVRRREAFRQISYVRAVAVKTFMGLGFDGYRRAILYLKEHFGKSVQD